MSQSFEFLVRAYCLTCVSAGIIQEFFAPVGSKKIMRGITGLYMIATVLHCLGAFSLDTMQPIVPQTENMPQTPSYTDLLLEQTKANLEKSCTEVLAQNNITAQVQVELESTLQGDISIRRILLTGEKVEGADAILSAFSAKEILWQTGEAYG